MLQARLAEDGDDVHFVITLPEADAALEALKEPDSNRGKRAFLTDHKPDLVVWIDGAFPAGLLGACAAQDVPVVAVNARAGALQALGGRWLPGRTRSILAPLRRVHAVDQATALAFQKAGLSSKRIIVAPALQELPEVQPVDPDSVTKRATEIGTRPTWLALGPKPAEWSILLTAHRQATRRAHRLLLVVLAATPDHIPELAEACAAAALSFATPTSEPPLTEATQVFCPGTLDDLGLWCRVVPISFIGGSFHGDLAVDPYVPVTLGSVPLHGPRAGSGTRRLLQLVDATATQGVSMPDALGDAVSVLLAPDVTAQKVTAGWDAITRGADIADLLIDVIQQIIDGDLT